MPRQISRLVKDVQRLQSSLTRLKDASAGQVSSLEEQLTEKSSTLTELEVRLTAQSDYEEMKRELRLGEHFNKSFCFNLFLHFEVFCYSQGWFRI